MVCHVKDIGYFDGIEGEQSPAIVAQRLLIGGAKIGGQEDIPVLRKGFGLQMEQEIGPVLIHIMANGPQHAIVPFRKAMAEFAYINP